MALPAYANNQQSFPAMYEQQLVGPLFRPWAELLLARLRPAPGERVLDIACGTGIVARLAAERVGPSGTVVGVDVSPGMLEVARAVAPGVTWRDGSALDLPLTAGEQFDVVVCQQGLQFFADRPLAVRQMRKALAAGGRLGVATWRPVAEIPIFRQLQPVAERHIGAVIDQRHAFGDGQTAGGVALRRRHRRRGRGNGHPHRAVRRRHDVRPPEHDGAGGHVRRGEGDERRGAGRRGGRHRG